VDQPTIAMTRDTTTPERHGARAALYAAVAVPFLFPDEERLGALQDGAARESLRSGADRLGLRAAVDRLLEAVADRTAADLEPTYNELFGLPGEDGTYPVVPYEAHYTAGAEVNQEQRRVATVVGLMEAFGVEPSEEFAERQDHVASELELMQVIAGQRAVARHRGDPDAAGELAEAEATVLAEHLVDFVPSLAHDVREATDHPVYLAAADLAEALVEYDHAAHPEPTDRPREVTAP